MSVDEIRTRLQQLGSKPKAQFLQRYFKTGPGEYSQGDLFHGIQVPPLRKLTIEYQRLTIDEVLELLASAFHEERLLALLLLVRFYSRGGEGERKKIYDIRQWDGCCEKSVSETLTPKRAF
jgi:DNA alkylation repair enzyme